MFGCQCFFFRIDAQHLLLILIQALPIFCYFLLQDFCDGGTLHEKIVSAREVSKSSKYKLPYITVQQHRKIDFT